MKKQLAVLLLAFLAVMMVAGQLARAAHLPIVASQDWWPVFSPDGTKVAFTQVSGNSMTLEVVTVATKRTVKIASNQGQLSPSWSSSGKLAFSLGGKIYTENPNGTDRARITPADGRFYAPAWRPGSTTELAYLTTIGAKNTDLWVAGKLWAANAIGNPAWSPDGSQLAFQRDDGIYVTTAPGAEHRIASAANPRRPLWSPDGRTIAFVAAKKIWLVPADGSSAPRTFASVDAISSDPTWVPDGTALAYTANGWLWVKTLKGYASRLHAAASAGASVSSVNGAIAFSGSGRGCARALLLDTATRVSTLAGCEIVHRS